MTISNQPSLRRDPTDGTILRIPLQMGKFAYALCKYGPRTWLFDFITDVPAKGSGFFSQERLRHVLNFTQIPTTFVNCGKFPVEVVHRLPKADFYYELDERDRLSLGVDWKYATSESGALPMDCQEISLPEALGRGLHLYQWLTCDNYELIIGEWLPLMSIREVPKEFIDHEALRKMAAGEPVEEKPLPQPRKVEFLIVFQSADLESDDPELDLEEPGCGDVAGSGTAPGVFEINVETISSDRARCLAVIRRVLKKAKAPASTIIKELVEPPIDHPLEAQPKPKRK
jgi:hypothetical protein